MLDNQTKLVLNNLKLYGFLEVLEEMQNSSQTVTTTEAIALMADREQLLRNNRRQQRLLKTAKLRHPQANIETIDYHLPRQFNQEVLRKMFSGLWLENARNLLLVGPTGIGKSFIACALGAHACKLNFSAIL